MAAEVDLIIRLLAATVPLVAVARVVGRCAQRIGQPAVVGEIAVGMLLGPSLVGRLWPNQWEAVFNAEVLDGLHRVSDVALVLFVFYSATTIDLFRLRSIGRKASAISGAGFLIPAGLGFVIAAWIHPRYIPTVDPLAFKLFIAAAMAVTALPVLIRILEETKQRHTSIGVIAIACAVVDDVTAWCLFGVVSALSTASSGWTVLRTIACTALFVLICGRVVRPLLAGLSRFHEVSGIVVAFGCAATTAALGTHMVFGAFLAGLIVPRDGRRTQLFSTRIAPVLVPVIFVRAGLSTRFDLLDSIDKWLLVVVIVAVASLGKLGGALVVAHWVGEPWRRALSIGVLLNARGVTELVLLAAGLSLGVIDPVIYSMFVAMALTTTAITTPVLRRLVQPSRPFGSALAFRIRIRSPQSEGATLRPRSGDANTCRCEVGAPEMGGSIAARR